MMPAITKAFILLAFPPGETGQFDWSEEFVEPGLESMESVSIDFVKFMTGGTRCTFRLKASP